VLYLAANKDAFVITTNNVGITAQLDHIATG
jgi:hypothetical protein